MLNPQYLTVFATIVQAGSISAAAAQLGCGKSVVSRQLARLEDDLGARLIQRSTRRLALTEIGKQVLHEARQVERAMSNIDQLAGQHQQEVGGLLRVSCSVAGRDPLVPLVAEFLALYPKVKVSLQMTDAIVDLIAEQIDVAIRTSNLVDSTLVARKLSNTHVVTVASPAYLARAGTPQMPEDLLRHACLVYTNAGRVYDEWEFIGAEGPYAIRVDGPFQINDGGSLVTAAVAGAGIVRSRRSLVANDIARGSLVEVLAHCPTPMATPVYAVYPARAFLALKTSTFIDFMQQRLSSMWQAQE